MKGRRDKKFKKFKSHRDKEFKLHQNINLPEELETEEGVERTKKLIQLLSISFSEKVRLNRFIEDCDEAVIQYTKILR